MRDESLDEARVALPDHENEELETTAVWLVDSALYLTLRDTDRRLRTRLILPPPRLMIGIAHLWLASVPPAPTGG